MCSSDLRHVHQHVIGRFSGALLAGTGLASFGAEMAHVAKVGQRVEPGIAHQPDITAVAAITAVGPALGNEALAPKADTAGPAGAGCHAYGGCLDNAHL